MLLVDLMGTALEATVMRQAGDLDKGRRSDDGAKWPRSWRIKDRWDDGGN